MCSTDGPKKMCLSLEPKILENNLKHVTVTKQIKGKSRGEQGKREREGKGKKTRIATMYIRNI